MSFIRIYYKISKKKLLSSLGALLCITLLGHSFAHARLSEWMPSFPYKDVAVFLKVNRIQTLDEYVLWLQKNITYTADSSKDDWADPLLTLNRRTGDCEDIAFLNEEVVKYFGYKPSVLAYGHGKEAHVICLFMKEGKYYIFDNTKFYRDISSPSLKEIFHFLATEHHAQFLLQLQREPRKLDVLYTVAAARII